MIPEDRMQEIINSKDAEKARDWVRKHRYTESWTIVDGVMVIYDLNDPPSWLKPILAARDEDGNTPSFYKKAA